MERLEFDLLFRWFVGIGVDDAAWDHSTFSKNRDRLLEGDIAAKLLRAVLAQPRIKRLLSTDHFSVDGTLIEAWASMKSFKPKDGDQPPVDAGGRNRETDFHGQKRSNDTHASTTDPEARLYRKGPGKEAKLCFMGHALMESPSRAGSMCLNLCFILPTSPAEILMRQTAALPSGKTACSTMGHKAPHPQQDRSDPARIGRRRMDPAWFGGIHPRWRSKWRSTPHCGISASWKSIQAARQPPKA
jgi:Transposase domain (DUF772)